MKNDTNSPIAQFQKVWNTEEDLDTILYRIMDAPDGPPSEYDITTMLMGLKEIHNSRCMKLWDTFETMVHAKCFTNKDAPLDYKGVPIDEDEDAMQGKFWPSECWKGINETKTT